MPAPHKCPQLSKEMCELITRECCEDYTPRPFRLSPAEMREARLLYLQRELVINS